MENTSKHVFDLLLIYELYDNDAEEKAPVLSTCNSTHDENYGLPYFPNLICDLAFHLQLLHLHLIEMCRLNLIEQKS